MGVSQQPAPLTWRPGPQPYACSAISATARRKVNYVRSIPVRLPPPAVHTLRPAWSSYLCRDADEGYDRDNGQEFCPP